MIDEIRKKLEGEIGEWQKTLETLRMRANLGKMELRDKSEELGKTFDKAYQEARKKIDVLRKEGGQHVEAATKGLDAAWEKLRDTYKDVREKQKKQQAG
jgi:hypothetical protein